MAISSTDNLRYPLVMQGETFTRRNICVFHCHEYEWVKYSLCFWFVWCIQCMFVWNLMGKTRSRYSYGPAVFASSQHGPCMKSTTLTGFLFSLWKTIIHFRWYLHDFEVTHEVHRSQKVFFAPITPASPYWCLFNWRLYWDDVRRFGCSFRSLCCPNGQSTFPQPNLRDCWTIHRKTVQTAQKIIPKSASSSITATSLCSNTEWAPDAVLILKRYSHGCSRSKDGDENLTVFHVVFSRVCSGVQCAFAFCEYAMPLLTGPKTIMEIYSNLITCAYQSEHICQYWACIATGLQTYGRNAPVMPA